MKRAVVMLFFVLFVSAAYGEIYKWVDADGKTHFSDAKPKSDAVESVTLEINTYTDVSFDDGSGDIGERVVMYSTSWCGYCKKARRYFERNNIVFVEYDIERNRKAKVEYDRLGGRGVPVILVGTRRMNGFSVAGFKRIYR